MTLYIAGTGADGDHVSLWEVSGSGLTALARRLAGAVAVFGGAVLLLWVAAPVVIADVAWGGNPTKPSTAIALLLVGLAVGLGAATGRVRRAMSVVALLLGFEGMLATALGRPLLTASLLFPDAWGRATPDRSGQMALGTAIGLVCVAGSLLVGRARRRLATALCAAAFALGWVALIGHLYGVTDLYSLQTASRMALPTAAALMLAAAATAVADPAMPVPAMLTARGTAGVLVRRLLPWAVLAPPVLGSVMLAGDEAGWYAARFGLSLMVGAFTVSTVTATILGARTAGRIDRAREAAAGELEVLNAVLSERVAAAVAEAEEGRERLGFLLDGTPVGIFETGPDGVRRYVNQRFRELAGIPDGEAAGNDWTAVLHPEDRERVIRGWAAAVADGSEYSERYRYLRPDATVSWVDVTALAVRAGDGTVNRWLGSVTDVTDQVEAAGRLSASEQRYRSVVATMAEGVVLMDRLGRIVTVNEAACQLLGQSAAELVGLEPGDPRWRSVRDDGSDLPFDDHPSVVALWTRRAVRDVTLAVHRPDGSVVWLMVSAEPLVDADGGSADSAGGVVTTFADVTAARAAAAALRRSEAQFRHAMALAPIGMAIVELDGRFREVNRSLARLVGYDESELVGLTFQQITHPDDLEADLGNVARLMDGSLEHYTMEKRYITRSGETVWVLLAVSMARDDRDRPAYLIAQIQDITDTRAAQQRLAHRALHDPLTGLPNRDLLMDHLSHTLARSARSHTSAVVMFCDLDHFKVVNDTYGHEAGDQLLVAVADRLRAVMRPGDTVGRLGGDEFVIVAEGLPDATAVRALAERVQRAFDEPLQLAGHAVRTGASIGVAIANAEDDARSVLREADAAMYRAKALGRDRLELSAGAGDWADDQPAAEELVPRRA